jgi:hypothetical protein
VIYAETGDAKKARKRPQTCQAIPTPLHVVFLPRFMLPEETGRLVSLQSFGEAK